MLIVAHSFSQNITINKKNKPLKEIINSIEEQTSYRVLFNAKKVNNATNISLNVTNTPLKEVLNILAKELNIDYIIQNKQLLFIDKKTAIETRGISGIVKSKVDNFGIPNATIIIKGTKKGAVTDIDGKFKYLINDPDVGSVILEVSYLGFKTKEVPLENKTYFEILLDEGATNLSEIVITSSYGTQKLKEEVVGSIATVNAKDLGVEQPVVSFDELLEGQVAGVSIETSPRLGEAVKINIRGQGSLTPLNGNVVGTSTQPLIIIDGIILAEEVGLDGNTIFDGGDGNLSENFLNPLAKIGVDDIESFSILKDAAAVGLYGADAANGVIIITTKKGKKGALQFNASSQVGITKAFSGLKYLNGEQYRTILNEYNRNSGNLQGVQPWNGINTNWFNLLNTDGLFNRVNFSASGGKKDFTYRVSLGFQKTAEAQINNSYQKLNSSFSLGYRKDKFDASLVFSPSITLKKDPNKLYSFALQPDIAPFDENGDFTPFANYGNPIAVANQNISDAKTFAFLTSLKADYSFSKKLKISSLFGLDFSKKDEDRFFSGLNDSGDFGTDKDSRFYRDPTDSFGLVKGRRVVRDRNTQRWNWNSNIAYNTVFGENHNFDGILGIELRQEKVDFTYSKGDGFEDFTNAMSIISNAFKKDFQNDSSENTGRSLFSQFNYNFSKKYFFLINLRLDQSSAFGNDRNTAFNGGIGASWNISKEDFLKDNKFIDFLRARISYGTTGNSRIGSYRALGLYTKNRGAGYNDFNYANLSSAPNPNLTWETNKKFNVGLDFNFLRKFQFTTDFFRDVIVDQIVTRNVIVESGFTSAEINGAAMYNQGIEFALNAEIVKNKNFSWSANFNFTTIENKVTSLVGLGSAFSAAENARAQTIGFSTSTLWGFDFIGIDPATGRELFNVNDQIYDGAQVRSLFDAKDWKPIGDSQDDFYGGLRNSIRYKNFNLNIIMSYAYGADMLVDRVLYDNYNVLTNRNINVNIFEDAWFNPGDIAIHPIIINNNPLITNSTKYLFDNSHIKLKSVSLSYNFPVKKYNFPVNSLSVVFNGSNLYYWFKDISPEGKNGIAEFRNQYPESRNFTLGINTTF
ncbi:SusC/RagA family TonB-linked outer membrane protein [Polaribacter glomeratus]|nr:SusC/RagA family TonB-linked outer membrane protein [Polaribacter glomeratus]